MPSMDVVYIPAADIDLRIAEIEKLMRELPVELAALRRIRAGAVNLAAYEGFTRSAAPSGEPRSGKPRDAVVEFLRRNPRKTRSEVVTALLPVVRSKAKDKRQLLKSTLYNLVRNGTLEQDESDRLVVAVKRKEVEP